MECFSTHKKLRSFLASRKEASTSLLLDERSKVLIILLKQKFKKIGLF